ncbi:MAG TPA: PQQ-binding-like beta-propeller repeat protein [Pyrinomonadaceae bacterium]|jgi:outer membrane protein assembly factor BamB
MFQQNESTPWYSSLTTLIAASLLLPPVGLVLLWIRRDLNVQKKALGSICILALLGGYIYLFSGPRSYPNEEHYAALERHRAEQQRLAAQQAAQPASVDPAAASQQANANPAEQNAQAQNAQQPGQPASNGTDMAHPSETARPARNYWTDFRGPARDGRYDELNIRTSWPAEGLPRLWKQPVGGGYASFVIAEGRAFTIEQRRGQEVAAAYDVETGRELWTNGWNADFRESMGGDGPRATPTWSDGRVYVLGAEGELRCLDAKTGKPYWNRNILSDNGASNLQWGMSAAPLIVDDKVVVLPGGTSGKSVVAYNKLSGAPVWKSLNDQASYTSPMLVNLAGRRQILVVTAYRIVGLAPEDGSQLWETSWENSANINISQPIVVDKNRFFISAGYGKGAALIEVSGGGKSFLARKVWENSNMKNKFNSSVLHNGYIYGLDEGILSCVDVSTGERKWKGGRYGYGQVLLASGHLIITTESGEIVLVRAAPDQHAELARFSALEGRTWNNAALAGGRLLVRNSTQMACYNIAAQ